MVFCGSLVAVCELIELPEGLAKTPSGEVGQLGLGHYCGEGFNINKEIKKTMECQTFTQNPSGGAVKCPIRSGEYFGVFIWLNYHYWGVSEKNVEKQH